MINISIEPTSFCNAECYYCINSIDQLSHSQRKKYLPLEVHNKLIRELDIFINDFHCAPTFDKSIYLRYCGLGEPTLHFDFIKMFKEAAMCSNVKM